MPKKILFWFGADFTHFCLSHYLKKEIDAEFFAIIDITNKPKSFFKHQDLVNIKNKISDDIELLNAKDKVKIEEDESKELCGNFIIRRKIERGKL